MLMRRVVQGIKDRRGQWVAFAIASLIDMMCVDALFFADRLILLACDEVAASVDVVQTSGLKESGRRSVGPSLFDRKVDV
jgi:hypothetical protein